MAHSLCVLDIGSYSAKRVSLKIPFFGLGVASAQEAACLSAAEPKTRRSEQIKSARELLPGKRLAGNAVTVIMPAERPLNRFLDLPFSDRAKIESVLAFELENHLPLATGEFLYDYTVMDRGKNGSRLFVSAVPNKEADEFKDLFDQLNLDPRSLIHQGVAHARLADLLPEASTGRVAFIDIGHRKTVVTIVEAGRFAGCRVILQGGYEATRALSEQFSTSFDDAEREKHEMHLFPAGEGTAVGRVQEKADCLLESLRPMLRDIRQTFKANGAVDTIFLFGGGARLGGIDTYIRDSLKIPATLLFPSMLRIASPAECDSPQNVSAIVCGYASQKGSDAARVNFRQGAFAYEGDFKYVRGRLVYLSFFLLLTLAAFAAPQVMKYRAIVEEEEVLQSELVEISAKIFGEELDDWEEILAKLEEMPSAGVWTVFPDLTAHDVYWEVADIVARIEGTPTGEAPLPGATPAPDGAAPAADPALAPGEPARTPEAAEAGGEGAEAVAAAAAEALGTPPAEGTHEALHHLEMNQVKIDGASRTALGEGAVEFTGNASSVATMELFLTRLGQHSCFHNVQRTKQEILKATAGKEGWWRFTVEFTVACPRKAEAKREKEEEVKGEGVGKTPAGADEAKSGAEKGKPGKSAPGASEKGEAQKPGNDSKAPPRPGGVGPAALPGAGAPLGGALPAGPPAAGEARRPGGPPPAGTGLPPAGSGLLPEAPAPAGPEAVMEPGIAPDGAPAEVAVPRSGPALQPRITRPVHKELRGVQPSLPVSSRERLLGVPTATAGGE